MISSVVGFFDSRRSKQQQDWEKEHKLKTKKITKFIGRKSISTCMEACVRMCEQAINEIPKMRNRLVMQKSVCGANAVLMGASDAGE